MNPNSKDCPWPLSSCGLPDLHTNMTLQELWRRLKHFKECGFPMGCATAGNPELRRCLEVFSHVCPSKELRFAVEVLVSGLDSVVTCGVGREVGLVGNHAYSILDVRDIAASRLDRKLQFGLCLLPDYNLLALLCPNSVFYALGVVCIACCAFEILMASESGTAIGPP
eukprot:5137412-Amphidinium_carterae.1